MITYGMSARTLADRLSCSKEEAEDIISGFYQGFPNIKKFDEESQAILKERGYVTDLFGRRRRLPNAALPEYEFSTQAKSQFNPILGANGINSSEDIKKINFYSEQLKKATWRADKDKIIADANANGIIVKSNGGLIAKAVRQCLNARIQGTAASMTKLAMIMIREDEELNRLGFHLLVTVHDEVFGECPTENSERCGERLCEVMVAAAKTKCSFTPWKCDPYIVKRWYEDEACGAVRKSYLEQISNKTPDEAIDALCLKYPMVQKKYLALMAEDTFDCNSYEDI